MDTAAIRYFLLLAEHGDLNAAAKLAGTSEENINSAVSALQTELGCTLLLRDNGGLVLTAAGEQFLVCAHTIHRTLQDFSSFLRQSVPKPVSVSISLRACSGLLTPIFTNLKDAYQDFDLTLSQNAAENQCDLSITTEEAAPASPGSLLLLKEPLFLVVSSSHPLAGRKAVRLSELAKEAFIVQTRTNPLRTIMERNCMAAGFSPRIVMETDSIMAFSKLVSANRAVCIVPGITNCAIFDEHCSFIELIHPRLYRYLVLRWDPSRELNEACRTIRDYLSSFFEHLPRTQKKVFVHTFSQFDVYVNDTPVYFSNKKAKELLALLVDRQGGIVTMDQAIDCLWESEPYDDKLKRRYRSVIMALRATLKEYEIVDMVTFQRAGAHVNRNHFTCDLYEFIKRNPAFLSAFVGDYMLDYSWGERMLPLLLRMDV